MDWNSKAPPSWDFTELEQETFSNLGTTVNGSNTFGDQHRAVNREDFSVDLKLGHHHHHHHHHHDVGNSGNELLVEAGLPKPASSPSGSSKRSRGSYNGSQAVSCLVDGCNADLSNCRDYHRRHKVCELHSKTPQVTIGGHKQRFCQQCSRFHSLEEFDEGKRSCRKRLDGHNRRRRKPQPEPFSRYGNLFSNYHPGTQLLPFSSSLVYPSTAVVNPGWGGAVVKTEADSGLQNHHPQLPFLDKQDMFLGSSSPTTNTSYKGGNKPFPLLQDHSSQTTAPEVSACHHPGLLRAFPNLSESSSGSRSKAFYDVRHSDCALSLLSSPQAQTSEIGLGHNISPLGSIPMVHPALHAHGGGGGFETVSSVLVANAEVVHCPTGMFHMGSDGNEAPHPTHQTLPSHWG